jgi:hypothetical protein
LQCDDNCIKNLQQEQSENHPKQNQEKTPGKTFGQKCKSYVML